MKKMNQAKRREIAYEDFKFPIIESYQNGENFRW